ISSQQRRNDHLTGHFEHLRAHNETFGTGEFHHTVSHNSFSFRRRITHKCRARSAGRNVYHIAAKSLKRSIEQSSRRRGHHWPAREAHAHRRADSALPENFVSMDSTSLTTSLRVSRACSLKDCFGEPPKPTGWQPVLPGQRNASTRLHLFRRGKLRNAATVTSSRKFQLRTQQTLLPSVRVPFGLLRLRRSHAPRRTS
ncbi:MAG: hypothetical protein QOG67_979, partial [Verrucomicrobiota bacterium]